MQCLVKRLDEADLALTRNFRLVCFDMRRVDRAFKHAHAWLGARLGKLFRFAELIFHRVPNGAECFWRNASAREEALKMGDWISFNPSALFILGPVAREIPAHGVVSPSIRQGLDEGCSLSTPGSAHCFEHGGVDRFDVIAINRD